MKVAVTGSAGYLGQLVLRALDDDPAVESLLGLDVRPSELTSPKLTHRFADVRTADFRRHFEGCDVVYHLAFIVQPPKGMSMDTIEEINVDGSRRVFDGAVAAGVPKIVCASSTAAYGAHPDNPTGLTEDFPLRPNPDWYYSRTKGLVERMLDTLQRAHPDLVIVRFRPCIFIGPTTDNTLGKMFAAPLMFLVRPNDLVDLCWDADVVEAFRLGLHHDRSDTFNLTGADPRPIKEYAALLGKHVVPVPEGLFLALVRAGNALGLVPQADLDWARAMVGGAINASSARAREQLGWRPRYAAAGTALAFARARGIL
jgi:UDP-glucose 4-epimerase